MNDRVRYKCLKCGREILTIDKQNPPFCCGQKMTLIDEKQIDYKFETNCKLHNISDTEKENYNSSIDFIKSKF